ncbi:MAG: hypothetical protein SFY70_03385 [Bacteroidia bacterium]|nr:hypothetical protein [Bacteroidia bacterium]
MDDFATHLVSELRQVNRTYSWNEDEKAVYVELFDNIDPLVVWGIEQKLERIREIAAQGAKKHRIPLY